MPFFEGTLSIVFPDSFFSPRFDEQSAKEVDELLSYPSGYDVLDQDGEYKELS